MSKINNPQFQFSIVSLLTEDKEGGISGPMSPVLFAKEMAQLSGDSYNRVARIHFGDQTIFQRYEGQLLTCHDILILAGQYENDLQLCLWIDLGTDGLPVATSFMSDRELIITPVYREAAFARKLKEEEIQEIMYYGFDHPGVLAVKRQNEKKY